MTNIGWTLVSVGTVALLAVAGILASQRRLRGEGAGFPLREGRTLSHELTTLGGSLVVLGIVFGTDRLIGYSFIGAGVLVSLISILKARQTTPRSSAERR